MREGSRPQWDVAIWGTWPPPYGGMATHIVRLLERLEPEDIRARVFNRASGGQDPPRAVSVRGREVRWFLRFACCAPERVLYVFTGRPLVRLLAWLLRRLRGKRYILRVGEESLLKTLAGGWSLGRWATLVALRGADCVVAVSPHLAEPILRAGVPPERVHVIPGFIPPGDPSAEPPAEVTDFARRHCPVLSANGQIWIEAGRDSYGLDLLLEALDALRREHPGIGLMLSLYDRRGAVSGLEQLKARIDEMGLASHVLIRDEPHEFWPMLKHTDIFLRPTRTEGDSGSIREAIYLGVPVVASDAVPRPKPVVLFRSGDGIAFVEAVRSVLGEFDRYKTEFAEATVEDNAQAVIRLLKHCLCR
ncbi:MAG TPA: glycosyltransferase [Phycisphaerae bacterium]|nr:glycosyltransferase [Phycisphaerae bacterium]